MALAAVAALASAFATRPSCFQCEHMPQYRLYNGQYIPAGDFGLDFDCDVDITSTCTYYKPTGSQTYLPCREGRYNNWTGRKAGK
jgi:hypothetical protein